MSPIQLIIFRMNGSLYLTDYTIYKAICNGRIEKLEGITTYDEAAIHVCKEKSWWIDKISDETDTEIIL